MEPTLALEGDSRLDALEHLLDEFHFVAEGGLGELLGSSALDALSEDENRLQKLSGQTHGRSMAAAPSLQAQALAE